MINPIRADFRGFDRHLGQPVLESRLVACLVRFSGYYDPILFRFVSSGDQDPNYWKFWNGYLLAVNSPNVECVNSLSHSNLLFYRNLASSAVCLTPTETTVTGSCLQTLRLCFCALEHAMTTVLVAIYRTLPSPLCAWYALKFNACDWC